MTPPPAPGGSRRRRRRRGTATLGRRRGNREEEEERKKVVYRAVRGRVVGFGVGDDGVVGDGVVFDDDDDDGRRRRVAGCIFLLLPSSSRGDDEENDEGDARRGVVRVGGETFDDVDDAVAYVLGGEEASSMASSSEGEEEEGKGTSSSRNETRKKRKKAEEEKSERMEAEEEGEGSGTRRRVAKKKRRRNRNGRRKKSRVEEEESAAEGERRAKIDESNDESDDEEEEEGSSSSSKKRRKPYKLRKDWLRNLEAAKAFKEEHGTFDVPRDAEGTVTVGGEDDDDDGVSGGVVTFDSLRRWMARVRIEYRHFRDDRDIGGGGGEGASEKKRTKTNGRASFSSSSSARRVAEEKIRLLEDIEFDFKYQSWEDRLDRLRSFRETHGHCEVPPDHPDADLRVWTKRQRREVRKFLEGKGSQEVNYERYGMLKSLDFDDGGGGLTKDGDGNRDDDDPNAKATTTTPPAPPIAKETELDARKWESNYADLRRYKAEHGHCLVPLKPPTDLSRFVYRQRLHYNRWREGKPSRLTPDRLRRLQDVGFAFRARGPFSSWEDRIEQCRRFKERHGHLRVPRSDPILGKWTGEQRYYHKNMTEGKGGPMTEERARQLSELGFEFLVGRRTTFDRTKVKTWEERYEELVEFKETYGHTCVPQHYAENPELGSWVSSQRISYKRMTQGKPTVGMNPEKALKLATIGFVFDATCRRGSKISKDDYRKVGGRDDKQV